MNRPLHVCLFLLAACSKPVPVVVDDARIRREIVRFVIDRPDLPEDVVHSVLSEAEQRRFIDLYGAARARLVELPREQRARSTIVRFVVQNDLSRCADDDDNLRMAFALLSGAGVDATEVDDPTYLDMLARSHVVDHERLVCAVFRCLRQSPGEVTATMADRIAGATARELEPAEYATLVLEPFLTFVGHGYELPAQTEKAVYRSFANEFRNDKGQPDLGGFIARFRRYLAGKPLHARHLIGLNRYLEPHRLRMEIDADYSDVAELLDYRFDLDWQHLGSVFVLRRLGYSLLPSHSGMSTYSEPHVVVYLDVLEHEADGVGAVLAGEPLPVRFTGHGALAWSKLGVPLDVPRAEKLYAALQRKAFAGRTHEQIVNTLLRSTAIHEVKHKWDEKIGTMLGWVVLDFEISAHLAQAIFSDAPEHDLLDLASRMLNYTFEATSTDVEERIDATCKATWLLALRVDKGELDRAALRVELREIYDAYRAVTGARLTNLGEFEKVIIKERIDEAPRLRLEK